MLTKGPLAYDAPTSKVLNVLLIEDDDIDAERFKRELRQQRIANPVFHAEDGVEALAALRDGSVPRPLIVVLDLHMPRMNGHEFLTELRADPVQHDIPVFVLTSLKDDANIERAYARHVAGYVLKDDPGRGFAEAIATLGSYWSLIGVP